MEQDADEIFLLADDASDVSMRSRLGHPTQPATSPTPSELFAWLHESEIEEGVDFVSANLWCAPSPALDANVFSGTPPKHPWADLDAEVDFRPLLAKSAASWTEYLTLRRKYKGGPWFRFLQRCEPTLLDLIIDFVPRCIYCRKDQAEKPQRRMTSVGGADTFIGYYGGEWGEGAYPMYACRYHVVKQELIDHDETYGKGHSINMERFLTGTSEQVLEDREHYVQPFKNEWRWGIQRWEQQPDGEWIPSELPWILVHSKRNPYKAIKRHWSVTSATYMRYRRQSLEDYLTRTSSQPVCLNNRSCSITQPVDYDLLLKRLKDLEPEDLVYLIREGHLLYQNADILYVRLNGREVALRARRCIHSEVYQDREHLVMRCLAPRYDWAHFYYVHKEELCGHSFYPLYGARISDGSVPPNLEFLALLMDGGACDVMLQRTAAFESAPNKHRVYLQPIKFRNHE